MRNITVMMLSFVLSFLHQHVMAQAADNVQAKLAGFEWTLDANHWGEPGDLDGLMIIAMDQDALPFLRGRALQALTLFPGEQAESVYLALIEGEESNLKRRAVDCVCEWPSSQTMNDALLPLLISDDKHLALRAAKCLGKNPNQSDRVIEALAGFRRHAEEWQVKASGLQNRSQ